MSKNKSVSNSQQYKIHNICMFSNDLTRFQRKQNIWFITSREINQGKSRMTQMLELVSKDNKVFWMVDKLNRDIKSIEIPKADFKRWTL